MTKQSKAIKKNPRNRLVGTVDYKEPTVGLHTKESKPKKKSKPPLATETSARADYDIQNIQQKTESVPLDELNKGKRKGR